jgi:hypothetical protein
MARILCERATILLIARQCQEVDEPISDVGRPQSRWEGNSPLSCRRFGEWGLGIGLEVSELVGIDGVTDASVKIGVSPFKQKRND